MRSLTDEEKQYLKDGGIIHYRVLKDGTVIGLQRMMYTMDLLSNIGTSKQDDWFYHRYCYQNPQLAIQSFKEWNGVQLPVDGWTAYKGRDTTLIELDKCIKNPDCTKTTEVGIRLQFQINN